MPTKSDTPWYKAITVWLNGLTGLLFVLAQFMQSENWETLLSIIPVDTREGLVLLAGLVLAVANLVDWLASRRGDNLAG